MHYRHGIPVMRDGFTIDQDWFCGGRVGVAVGKHGGITKVTYYGRQPMGGAEMFRGDPVAAWTKLFRLCVVVDGTPWHPGFRDTELLPCGFRSRSTVGGVAIRHELVVLDDAFVQRVRVESNPQRRAVSLRLVFHGGPARCGGPHRTWTGFAPAAGSQVALACAADRVPDEVRRRQEQERADAITQSNAFGNSDVQEGESWVAVASDQRLAFQDLHHGFKHHADTGRIGAEASFIVAFHWDRAALLKRVAALRRTVGAACEERLAAATAWPQVRTREPALGSFLSSLPAVVDALRVGDIPGGMRASAGHYWVWGWDSMVYSKGLMLAGHRPFVEQMLAFYEGLSDRRLGIPHSLSTTLTPILAMAFTAQCLYGVMLFNHWCATGDVAVLRRHFPFARWIVEQAMAREVKDSGLVDGPSLFPDFPDLLGHDGADLSVFNNSIFYQALLALRELALALAERDGDAGLRAFADRLQATAQRCRAGFRRAFFDEKAGYFIDSASARDFTRRMHHPSYAILWVTPYAADLVRDDLPRIAAYMAREFPNPRGIYHFPPSESEAFLSDGNQCSAYYPVIEPFYRNVMALAGRRRELAAWPGVVAWYWQSHTVPEGLTFDAANASDLTPDCPGGKQPFAGKAWYELFLTAYAGLDLGPGGLAVRATPVDEPVAIDGLDLGGRRLDVRISGRGRKVRVRLNGRAVADPSAIPLSAFRRGRNRLDVRRGV